MMGEWLLTLGILAVFAVILIQDLRRWRRERREWNAQDERFWAALECWEPGIRERIERRRGEGA